jgi:hypothetical protein
MLKNSLLIGSILVFVLLLGATAQAKAPSNEDLYKIILNQ